jgi:Flp pilus assembly protein TadD/DNA-binding MarR family transcriptional regulator
MNEARSFPYGGVPVYNPQSLSKDEALAQFHVRQAAYQSLMDSLREERPSHVLIIGTPGMGKTTLLQRVRYGVEDDTELNSRYLALVFPEEQYNVNHLHHFLLNAVDALADALERVHNQQMVARVEAFVGMAGKLGQEEIEERVPKFLAEIGRELGRSLLLLVDNADRLFETIEDKEQWRLRELLSSRQDLTLFGATTQASDGIYGHDRAFFEFFRIYTLTPLTLAEVRDLLLRLSESVDEPEGEKGSAKRRVQAWLDADPARLRTLVQLTGGNPRTTVLLFHLVLDGLAGGAREYLEQLLDQCTPGYKGRVDELPSQAQQVLDAVALRWDPATAMEIAEDTRLETTSVSAQLTRLVRQGLLEKADPGDSKKALYQVAERFFNIWYLMRASRRVRAKLRWFVEFLRVFFDPDELEQMGRERLECLRSGKRARPEEIENAFAFILASRVGRRKFEDYLRREFSDSEPLWGAYLDLIESFVDEGLASKRVGSTNRSGGVSGNSQEEVVVAARHAVKVEPNSAKNWRKLGSVLGHTDEAEAAYRRAIDLDPKDSRSWGLLGAVLSTIPGRSDEAEEAVRRAVEFDPQLAAAWALLGGILATKPGRLEEAEEALRRAVGIDPKFSVPWEMLGHILAVTPERLGEAEVSLWRAVELDPADARVWSELGVLLERAPERASEAEVAHRKAIELDPTNALFWSNLGDLLGRTPGRASEAEVALRKAIELDPAKARLWNNLAILLEQTPERTGEAEVAYRRAIDLSPTEALFWNNLGDLLERTPGRASDAEIAYRKAIEFNPTQARFWHDLGYLLDSTNERKEEAEASYRRAIELDPTKASFWNGLGNLLGNTLDRRAEAQLAYRKAIELEPESAAYWGTFGVFLACGADRPREAEVALRKAVDLDRNSSRNLRNLGVLLFCEAPGDDEAVRYIRRASQLRPEDPVSAAVFAACARGPEIDAQLPRFVDAAHEIPFWDELLELCENYGPFGKILSGICDLALERDSSNAFAKLCRAVALAQAGDFPRASVALEDALVGDPIDLLASGKRALEVFFAAAVRNGRVRDCLELLDKKEWKDAWRPIYEALRAVEAGSGEYLKRVAVEIRGPAMVILRRIAPELPGLAAGG